MNKRELFTKLTAGVLATGPLAIIMAGTSVGKSIFAKAHNFVVPAGMTKLNIKSYKDGKQILDYTINVEPGQIFTVTPQE